MLNSVLSVGVIIMILGFIASSFKKRRMTNKLREQIDSINKSFEKNSETLNNRIEMEYKRVVHLEAQVILLRNQLDKSNEIIDCNISKIISTIQEASVLERIVLNGLMVLDGCSDDQDKQLVIETLKNFLVGNIQQLDKYVHLINTEKEKRLNRIYPHYITEDKNSSKT